MLSSTYSHKKLFNTATGNGRNYNWFLIKELPSTIKKTKTSGIHLGYCLGEWLTDETINSAYKQH